jgi:hypothetical protein
MCCDIPNDPGEVNEFDCPPAVTAVNIEPPLALYMYCGAIEFDKLEGPWLNV